MLTNPSTKNRHCPSYRNHPNKMRLTTLLYNEIRAIMNNNDVVITDEFYCSSVDWNGMTSDQEGGRLMEQSLKDDAFFYQVVSWPTLQTIYWPRVHKWMQDRRNCDHHMIRFKINTGCKLNNTSSLIPNFINAKYNPAPSLPLSTVWDQLDVLSVDAGWTAFRKKLEMKKKIMPAK